MDYERQKHIFMDYANGGTLNSLKRDLTEKEFWFIIKKLVEGLTKFEDRKYVHRDLKPDNILLHFPEYENITTYHMVEQIITK